MTARCAGSADGASLLCANTLGAAVAASAQPTTATGRKALKKGMTLGISDPPVAKIAISDGDRPFKDRLGM
jgi:hypothetical protein